MCFVQHFVAGLQETETRQDNTIQLFHETETETRQENSVWLFHLSLEGAWRLAAGAGGLEK